MRSPKSIFSRSSLAGKATPAQERRWRLNPDKGFLAISFIWQYAKERAGGHTGTVSKITSQLQVMTLDWHQSSASHLANLYRQICLGEGKYIFRVLYMGYSHN